MISSLPLPFFLTSSVPSKGQCLRQFQAVFPNEGLFFALSLSPIFSFLSHFRTKCRWWESLFSSHTDFSACFYPGIPPAFSPDTLTSHNYIFFSTEFFPSPQPSPSLSHTSPLYLLSCSPIPLVFLEKMNFHTPLSFFSFKKFCRQSSHSKHRRLSFGCCVLPSEWGEWIRNFCNSFFLNWPITPQLLICMRQFSISSW